MRKNLAFICGIFMAGSVAGQNNSTVRETIKPYPTYAFSDPDPIPNEGKIYPYFRYDGFAEKSQTKSWKIVELENDYLRVQVMPEIGGKIWTAFDKKHGKYFLYNNDVVKFRDIAMRGPWTSGGLEANFGIIGHTPAVATPVDYLTRNNQDGSVSCIIGCLDLLTRSQWNVEIRLPKDKAYFITKVYWHNTTAIERPYYSWMNMAAKTDDSLLFIDPGGFYLGHEGHANPWPMDSARGKDLSIYGQNNFGADKSYHIFGSPSPYYGAYWKKDDYGMIHYANREDKAGKKIFLWALSDEGKIWEHLLTDSSGQYAEIQSGRLFNQNIYKSSQTPFKQMTFMPYQADKWEEYWYPFSGTGGVSNADLNAVIHYDQSGDSLSISVSAVGRLQDSLVLYDSDGKMIASRDVSLSPLEQKRFSFGGAAKNFDRLSLQGSVIFRRQNDKELGRPTETLPNFDWNSAYGQYLKGREQARFGMYDSAENNISASLLREPGFMPALTELSLLQFRRMRYDSALLLAKKALRVDTYDPQSNYCYAIASEKLDKVDDALDGFEIASMNAGYRVPAFTGMSRIFLKQGLAEKAEAYALKALNYDHDNLTALELLFVCQRIRRNGDIPADTKMRILSVDPLNHFVAFENYWQKRDSASAKMFSAFIRSELPAQTYLELAIWYYGLGRNDESKALLAMAPANNEIQYWQAFLETNEQNRMPLLTAANAGDPAMVFPFREESAVVMDWAARHSHDWKPRYYLALIALSKKNKEEAISQLRDIDSTVSFAPAYVVRSRLYPAEDSASCLRDLQKALSLDREGWRYRKLLAEFYLSHHQAQKAYSTVNDFYRRNPENYIIGTLVIRCLLANDDYVRAEKILDKIHILPFEGARDGRKLYRETKLMLALRAVRSHRYALAAEKIQEAGQWPMRLGVGKPYAALIDTRLEDQLAAACRELQRDSKRPVDYEKIENEIRHLNAKN